MKVDILIILFLSKVPTFISSRTHPRRGRDLNALKSIPIWKQDPTLKPKKKNSVIQNVLQPKINVNQEIQKAYSILEDPIDKSNILPNLNKPDINKNRPKRGLVKKKVEDKKVMITGKNFEGQNLDVEKETNRVIDKMKNINKKN